MQQQSENDNSLCQERQGITAVIRKKEERENQQPDEPRPWLPASVQQKQVQPHRCAAEHRRVPEPEVRRPAVTGSEGKCKHQACERVEPGQIPPVPTRICAEIVPELASDAGRFRARGGLNP